MNAGRTSPLVALLGRVCWMLVGPLALVLFTYGIIRAGSGWVTWIDLGYFIVLGLMVGGRWLEFRGGNPLTSTGEPAKSEDLRRYTTTATGVGLAIWIAANILGNHIL